MAARTGKKQHLWWGIICLCACFRPAWAMDALVNCGVGAPQATSDEKVQLFTAVARDDLDELNRLIDGGAAWRDLTSANGSTLLHRALAYGRIDIALCLIARGADVRAANAQGWTPLHVAVCNRNEEGMARVARALLADGADPNVAAEEGVTPVSLAVQNRNVGLLWLLLEEGDVDPLAAYHAMECVRVRDRAIAELVRAKCQVLVVQNGTAQARNAAFLAAAGRGDISALRSLYAGGADVAARDEYGHSALHLAMKGRHSDAACFLIEAGANVGETDQAGGTSLHVAVDNDMPEVAIALLTHGADPCAENRGGVSPFKHAVEKGDPELIAHLVAAGADPQPVLPLAEWKHGAESDTCVTLKVLQQELERERAEIAQVHRQQLGAPDWDQFPQWLAQTSPRSMARAVPELLDPAVCFARCDDGDGAGKRQRLSPESTD